MGFTYTAKPETVPVDAVRLLVGDTDATDPFLQDAEIQVYLDQFNQNPLNASIRCCEAIIAKLARRPDEKVGQVSISYSQQAKAYRELRADLSRRLAMTSAAPYAGGISRSDKEARESNTDRVKPAFTREEMRNREASPFLGGNPFDNDIHDGESG